MTENATPPSAQTPEPSLPKTFDPAAIEAHWYAHWEDNGLFRPERPDAAPFTIVNPPPNVTGSLHIGHALDNTLQDIVIRYERLRGKDALWVVGTDHAGIATQMVVERQMNERGEKRTDFSREDFIAKVWEWKEQSGGTITRQLRRLGCSMDWSREQFTMDPHFTKAVVKVFVDLYNQDLIYRDKRLVNWDPKLGTAISDLEVETREINGHFWHFKYPLSDGSGHISVATTRPETMLADMVVAVHPTDERYAALVARGAKVTLPITGREIPIVADEHADPELGSGAVKITPGHDFNDFEVGKRAGIAAGDMLNMLDAEAKVCQTADGLIPADLLGLDRFEARKRVVELMDADGLLERVEERVIQTPYGDRGGVVIEPWLTDQWYVNAEELAKAPLEAVRSGAIEIVPKTWEKTFFNWMENIQPWCVSRQLWWGHRIPAWYGPDGKIFVAETEEAVRVNAAEYYQKQGLINPQIVTTDVHYIRQGSDVVGWIGERVDELGSRPHGSNVVNLLRDEDVLDTWFSSALWPFATLGWPEDPPQNGEGDHAQHGGGAGAPDSTAAAGGTGPSTTSGGPPPRAGEDLPTPNPSRMREGSETCRAEGEASRSGEGTSLLAKHYPNDLLISGFDILFFWDARMMMMGQAMTGRNPWKRLYLHGLVRAADGQKMSKSKGNVVDPLGLIDQYGADALRFFMAAMESQGRDVKMDEKRVEGYRNFATKLWNAARFCQANGIGASTAIAAPAATSKVNRWIIGEVVETLEELDKAMAELRFDAAANAIYHFVWDWFCDEYIETIKANFDDETKTVAGWAIDQILVMLHPFMPFVTEEIWSKIGTRADYPLITAQWPAPNSKVDPEAKRETEWVFNLLRNLRSARAELNVPPAARTNLFILADKAGKPRDDLYSLMTEWAPILSRRGRIDEIHFQNSGFALDARTGEQVPVQPDTFEGMSSFEIVLSDATLAIPLEGVIDIAAEKARLEKARAAALKEATALEGRLQNPKFVEKAKPEAVEKARADHAHHAAEAERLAAALARLG